MGSSDKLKVGVIGAGVLGRFHSNLYKQSANAEFVGIYDANPEVAQRIGTEFSVPVFATIDELSAACDGLSIAVPADRHHEVAMPLIRQGKHLLIEKPIAVTVKQAEDIVQAAERGKVVVAVGHVERYNPVMSYLEKRAGKTRFIEAHRLAPYPPPRPGNHPRGTEVGVVLDLMIHDLEIILHLVDSEVENIMANGIPILSKTEDIANARIQFKNGAVANVTASRVSPMARRKIRVFQTDCCINLDYQEKSGVIYTKGLMGIDKKNVPVKDHNALQEELEEFIRCAAHARGAGEFLPQKVSGMDGLRALKLAIDVTNALHDYNKRYGFYNYEQIKKDMEAATL